MIGYCKRAARAVLKGKWLPAASVVMLALVISNGVYDLFAKLQDTVILALRSTAGNYLVMSLSVALVIRLIRLPLTWLVSVGVQNHCIRTMMGHPIHARTLFPVKTWPRVLLVGLLRILRCAWPIAPAAVIASMTSDIDTMVGIIAIAMIPVIILALRYSAAEYFLLTRPGMSAGEALDRSARLMQGQKARYFFLQLSFIGWIWLQLAAVTGISGLMDNSGGMAGSAVIMIISLVTDSLLNLYMSSTQTVFFMGLETAYRRQEQAESPQAQSEPEPESPVDEEAAEKMFFAHDCSRRAIAEAGLTEEFEKISPGQYMESRWMRRYEDMLILSFDRDSDALEKILRFAAEYAETAVIDRAIMRIDRHLRQNTLPMEDILSMAGRTLALVRSGVYDDQPAYAARKAEQIAGIVDRIGAMTGETETIKMLREMLGSEFAGDTEGQKQ